jgi:phage/plasmid-associated DNA primase
MSGGILRVPASPEELADLMEQAYDETGDADTIVTQCPAHDDHNPSLVVSLARKGRRKGRLLLHCRAGCSHIEVIAALAGMGIAIDAIEPDDARSELDAALRNTTGKTARKPGDGAETREETDHIAADGGVQSGPEDADEADHDETEAEDELTSTAGIAGGSAKPADPAAKEQLHQARQLWMTATDIKGTLAEAYLNQERGLPLPGIWFDAVRESDAVRFSQGGALTTERGPETGPCMIARITRVSGRVIGYQITPLSPEGHKQGRFIIGQYRGGGAIRIWRPFAQLNNPTRPALILCEGLETGLSRLVLEDQPLEVLVLVSDLPRTAGDWAESLTLERLKRAEGAIDYRERWSHIELAIDRDKERDIHVSARKVNAATGLAVRCLLTSTTVEGKGADLNDLLRVGGWVDLLAAQVRAPVLPPGYAVMTAPKQEGALADEVVRLAWHNAAGRTRVSQKGVMYQWDGRSGRWCELESVLVNNEVHHIVIRSFEIQGKGALLPWHKSDGAMIKRLAHRAVELVTEPELTQPGSRIYRLSAETGAVALDDWIVCRGGRMLNIRTREVAPAGQDVFALNVINADPNRLEEVPERFEQVLREAFETVEGFVEEDIEQQIKRIYEFIGYAIHGGRLNLQRLLFLTGATGTGKGLTERVLEAVLGESCEATSLSQLGGPHGTATLVDAAVIKLSDIRRAADGTWHTPAGNALGLILSIVGGDPVVINPKNRPLYTARLTQCVMAVANEVPPYFVDGEGALGRRLETITFGVPKEFERAGDPELEDRILAAELSGILGRALDGLDRLRSTKRFSMSPGIARQQVLVLEQVEPLRRFVKYLTVSKNEFLTRDEVYLGYQRWVKAENTHPLSREKFFNQLRRALRAVHNYRRPFDRSRIRIAGKRVEICQNLTWHEDTPNEVLRDTSHIRPAVDDLNEELGP